MRSLIMVWLILPLGMVAQEHCTDYDGIGRAGASLALSFPGDPACVPGSITNSLTWHGSTTGMSACPTQFNTSTKQWAFSLTYYSDYDSGSGAGCWWGAGPRVYSSGTANCSSSGDVCEEAYVTGLGQWFGVGASGVYLAGATWYFGEAACWPANATYHLCTNGNTSPIIIDVDGGGYQLTSAAGGVQFDFYATGTPIQIAWTAVGSTNAFLVLPQNGVVTNGTELFGNLTPQPISSTPNGFLALAVYDTNQDGVIDVKDPIFPQLRLWQDANHDGIVQPGELHTLPSLGVVSISLNYQLKKWTDVNGNQFRYRARIQDAAGNTDRWVYDVILAQ